MSPEEPSSIPAQQQPATTDESTCPTSDEPLPQQEEENEDVDASQVGNTVKWFKCNIHFPDNATWFTHFVASHCAATALGNEAGDILSSLEGLGIEVILLIRT